MMKTKFHVAYILLMLMLTACDSPANQTADATVSPPPQFTKQPTPEPTHRDIPYCVMDGVVLKMDIYKPDSAARMPAIIFVHGGAWVKDSKTTGIGKDIPVFMQAGIAVFSIDYRLGKEYKFPAMIEDVKCGIRSLRAHAEEYNIDPQHIGAYGGSAGGHLVALLGVSDESAGFDTGEYLEYSSRVQAVVDVFGPTDLTKLYQSEVLPSIRVAFLESDLERASPANYVSPDDPPFLILHGTKDEIVPLEQSQVLYDLLIANDVPAELIVVENGGHGFGASSKLNPTRVEIIQRIADFFVETLQ